MGTVKARDVSPVRLRPDDKRYIQKLAKETKSTQTEVLHHAIELLKRERNFRDIRETYAGLNEDEVTEVRNETGLFDRSSGDGLK